MEKKDIATGVEDTDFGILTRELLTNARALLEELQEIIKMCNSFRIRRPREWSVCVATIREDGETLVIDGFRFDDAASREDLGRLPARGCRTTHD